MIELDCNVDVYIVDLSKEYNMNNIFAQFILKTGKPGDSKQIIDLNVQHVMFYNENLYDNVSEVHFHRTGQTVSIVYNKYDVF